MVKALGDDGGDPNAIGNEIPIEIAGETRGEITALIEREYGLSVAGRVFHDLDRDGLQDPGEPGVGGVTVALLDTNDVEFVSTGTAGDGTYLLFNLSPGNYRAVFRDLPPDFVFSPASQGSGTDDSDPDPGSGITPSLFLDVGDDLQNIDAGINLPSRPVATDDSGTYTPGVDRVVFVLDNDTTGDPIIPSTVRIRDGVDAELTLAVPGQGEWNVNTGDGTITPTPDPGYEGDPTPIQYTGEDAFANVSNPATVTLTAEPQPSRIDGVVWPTRTGTARATPANRCCRACSSGCSTRTDSWWRPTPRRRCCTSASSAGGPSSNSTLTATPHPSPPATTPRISRTPTRTASPGAPRSSPWWRANGRQRRRRTSARARRRACVAGRERERPPGFRRIRPDGPGGPAACGVGRRSGRADLLRLDGVRISRPPGAYFVGVEIPAGYAATKRRGRRRDPALDSDIDDQGSPPVDLDPAGGGPGRRPARSAGRHLGRGVERLGQWRHRRREPGGAGHRRGADHPVLRLPGCSARTRPTPLFLRLRRPRAYLFNHLAPVATWCGSIPRPCRRVWSTTPRRRNISHAVAGAVSSRRNFGYIGENHRDQARLRRGGRRFRRPGGGDRVGKGQLRLSAFTARVSTARARRSGRT
ncbi:MAG: SdrD B-like domain-containing protein [Kiritimatiellia bacterium]